MANVPLSGTNLRLLSGVPFQNDYKNSRWFTSKASQLAYFTSKPVIHQESQKSFQQIEGKHYVSVNRHIDDLWNVNYLMFQNAQYNNKWFYAFVTKLEYRQGNNTRLYFEVDVLQTWKFDMQFKPSYVVREHRPLWNADGSPVINTIDEGLDYGAEYETVEVSRYSPYGKFHFVVIVMQEDKSSDNPTPEDGINPSRVGIPQPLTYYIHPIDPSTGNVPNIMVGSTGTSYSTNILDVLKGLSTQTGTVNNVVSIYLTENIGDSAISHDSNSNTMTLPENKYKVVSFSDGVNVAFSTIKVKNVGGFSTHTKDLGNKYSGYNSVTESKLLMYPYTSLILDDFKGNRVEIKNEHIVGKNLKIISQGSIGTNNKVTYSVLNYLTDSLGEADERTISNEVALINSDPQDLPVLNDLLSAFMQGNRNSLNTQRKQIRFDGFMSQVDSTISAVASAKSKNPVGVASGVTGIARGAGNQVLALQAINSKIRDIDNTPASLQKMGSNVNFDYGNQLRGLYIIKKQIRPEYRKILSDFFNMFGYKTNEVKIPNFRTRQNWNYVQTEGCNILGNINNNDLTELKSIFDNGITLWHTDDIGNYSLANGVR